MGDYITKKSDMKFQSQEALKSVQSVIDDADAALHDKSRRIEDSPIGDAVAGAVGVGVGAGIGFAGLYLGGSVVGLSAAGITSGLAAAGGIDLASASDMVTDAMSALGMGVDEAGTMVDQMAKTASSTNTSVAQLGEGILTIGATAKSVKGDTAELNTALGILANNGIKSAEGGTHLRNIILSLQNPTDKAADQMEALGLASVFCEEPAKKRIFVSSECRYCSNQISPLIRPPKQVRLHPVPVRYQQSDHFYLQGRRRYGSVQLGFRQRQAVRHSSGGVWRLPG